MPQAFLLNGQLLKQCAYSECGAVKPVDEFNRNKVTCDGYAYYCQRCQRHFYNIWRRKNKRQQRQKSRAFFRANRDRINADNRRRYWRRKVNGVFKTQKYNAVTSKRKQRKYNRTPHGIAWGIAHRQGEPSLKQWLLGQERFYKACKTYKQSGYCQRSRPCVIQQKGRWRVVSLSTMRKFYARRQYAKRN